MSFEVRSSDDLEREKVLCYYDKRNLEGYKFVSEEEVIRYSYYAGRVIINSKYSTSLTQIKILFNKGEYKSPEDEDNYQEIYRQELELRYSVSSTSTIPCKIFKGNIETYYKNLDESYERET